MSGGPLSARKLAVVSVSRCASCGRVRRPWTSIADLSGSIIHPGRADQHHAGKRNTPRPLWRRGTVHRPTTRPGRRRLRSKSCIGRRVRARLSRLVRHAQRRDCRSHGLDAPTELPTISAGTSPTSTASATIWKLSASPAKTSFSCSIFRCPPKSPPTAQPTSWRRMDLPLRPDRPGSGSPSKRTSRPSARRSRPARRPGSERATRRSRGRLASPSHGPSSQTADGSRSSRRAATSTDNSSSPGRLRFGSHSLIMIATIGSHMA